MTKAYVKISSAKILSALLFVISLGLAELAHAEVPVTGRLQDARPRTQHGRKPFLHPRGAKSLARSKRDARLGGISLPGLLSTTSPSDSSTLPPALEVTGFDGIDQDQAGVEPPDGAIAVSPTYLVQATNINLSVWTKTYDETGRLSAITNTVSAADLDSFLGENPNCYSASNSFFGLVSDPSVDYDVAQDRFMVSMISFDQLSLSSSLCVAVTATGNPAGDWFIYAFPMPAFSLLDFPRAVTGSDGHIYIAGNFFVFDQTGQPTFVSSRVYALKTIELYGGIDTVPSMAVVGSDPESGAPADSLTPARAVLGGPGMYFVSASNPEAPATGSAITLWKWSDPFGANVFTRQGSVTVSTYTQPPPGVQLGGFPAGVTDCEQPGAVCIETNDVRNVTAYWSGGTVWAAHTVGCAQGGELAACVQWYQLGNLDGAPTLLQQGIVDDPTNPGRYRYFPSMAVDSSGRVVLGYGYSSASEYPGVAISTISATGEVGPETVLKTGQATFFSSRYGDYDSAALDPTDNLTIWQEQEYAKGSGTWGTWVSAIQIGGIPVPPSLSVTPTSLDFGSVKAGSTADKTIVVQNTGGGKLIGSASATAPFSIISGGSFTLTLGATQTVVVRFSPAVSGIFTGNISFTSNAGDASVAVTGTGAGVDAIAPNSVDLAAPPAGFTVSGNGFADLGFGLPVMNFVRNGTLIAQARATAIGGSTSLTVPFPTAATAIVPNLPGLSTGTVQAQLYLQTSATGYMQIGAVSLTVIDTSGVSAITPNTVDLAAPPASFTITGAGFMDKGFGLPVVNFTRGSTILAQARATGLDGSTSLTVPFPTPATAIAPNLPGLSAGTVQAQVYLQTSATGYKSIGGVSLTVNDTSAVSAITPNTVDLAAPPASFTITGAGFMNKGFGLPVVNFTRGSTILAQARATGLTGSTSLTVPFPTAATAIVPNLPGLSAGTVQVQVYLQTSATSYKLIGSVPLTVIDTRVASGVSAITPNIIDLAAPPASFTITGWGFVDKGFGLPVVNFTRNSTVLAQARATGLTGGTTLTVPFPTAATAIAPNLPGLSAGAVQVQVYLQTSATGYTLIGSVSMTVNDTRVSGVTSITPNIIDLAAPPASFTITGAGFADKGFGLPVVNFTRGSTVLAQARATALTGSTSLTVPFPTAATAIAPNLPGLSAGTVQVQVYLQTGATSYTLIGGVSLTVNDTR